ncbi:hypothetical protein [Methylobacterium durans]|uniref:hypothetical protein n=1 Tax=Methylobacterium durans TaxID=2202825 RepID=UPI0013A5B376|nr:hypothetical protein [Methylobacterium durans]
MIITAAAVVALGSTVLWGLLGELVLSKLLIILAYISALQAGYIVSSYLTTPQDPN